MKQNVIIRIENAMFNFNCINKHIAITKDKTKLLNASVPKRKLNKQFVAIIDMLKQMHSMNKLNVCFVTNYKFEYVYKLLSNNNLNYVKLYSTIENAIANNNDNSIVISANDNDLQCAIQNNVDCIKFPATTRKILQSIGIKRIKQKKTTIVTRAA